MKRKIDQNIIQAFLELYAKNCLETTEEDFDWRSDPKAVELLESIACGEDLRGRDFSGVNLKNAVIKNTSLKGVNLTGALLYNTVIENTDLSDANLSAAHLENVYVANSDLTGIEIPLIYVHNLHMKTTEIEDHTKKKLKALSALTKRLKNGEISLKDLSWTDLLSVDLSQIDLTDINLEDVDLSCISLEKVNLKGTYIDPKQMRSLQGLLHFQALATTEKLKKLIADKLKAIYTGKTSDDSSKSLSRKISLQKSYLFASHKQNEHI